MLVALGVGLRVGEAVLEVSRSLQVAFGRGGSGVFNKIPFFPPFFVEIREA